MDLTVKSEEVMNQNADGISEALHFSIRIGFKKMLHVVAVPTPMDSNACGSFYLLQLAASGITGSFESTVYPGWTEVIDILFPIRLVD